MHQPISEEELDWIDVTSYVDKLQTAIDQGAQMVAVTSDFGSGKSSLIHLLQKRYKSRLLGIQYHFCRLNLWCHLTNEQTTLEMHKTFLYQLANQINPKTGSYIAKRLSKNYGLFKIGTNSQMFSALTFLMVFIAVCARLIDYFTKSIVNHLPWLEKWVYPTVLILYAVAICTAIFLLMKADLIFSSKSSEGNRDIGENDVMDLYQTMILCRGRRKRFLRPKHFIVVLEDIDRTGKTAEVIQFLKEIRKYYMPNNAFSKNKNTVTFVVNIKPEVHLRDGINDEDSVYPKIFDYIMNLQQINIDNYDAILEGLISEKKEAIREIGLEVYDKNNVNRMKGIQWIIRGKNLGIREIKERLNGTFLLYESLTKKFSSENIDFEKCAVVSYITSAFAQDFYKMGDRQFEKLLEAYVSGKLPTIEAYKELLGAVSNEYVNEIKILIETKHIDINYRTYFYNYPKGSNLFNSIENKVWNTIVYRERVENDFDELVLKLNKANSKVVTKALDKVKNLSINFPPAIFESTSLFVEALGSHEDYVIKTMREDFRYKDDEILKTTEKLKSILALDSNRTCFNERIAKRLCSLWEEVCSPIALCQIRHMICKTFQSEVLWYKSLFMGINPLITKDEILLINELSIALELINRTSNDINLKIFESIHLKVLNSQQETIPITEIEGFYNHMISIIEEREDVIPLLLQYMLKMNKIVDSFELIVYEHIYEDDEHFYLPDYIKVLNNVAEFSGLTKTSVQNLHNLHVFSGITECVCLLQYRYEFYLDFVYSMINLDIKRIDFKDLQIQNTIEANCAEIYRDFEPAWTKIRYRIVESYLDVSQAYLFMFSSEYPLVSGEELSLINDLQLAMNLINPESITEEDLNMLSKYFNRQRRTNNAVYSILQFISSFQGELGRKLFYLLDMQKVPYVNIAKSKKNHIKELFRSSLNLISPQEKLRFMEHVGELDEKFEKELSEELKSDGNLRDAYVALINRLHKFNDITFQNIRNMGTIYAYNEPVNQELYKRKFFKEYVVSSVLKNNSFIIEHNKLDILYPTYLSLITGVYKKTKAKMAENREFLEILLQRKAYVGMPEESLMHFSGVDQSPGCLEEVISRGEAFANKYFQKIVGFESKEAAEKFIEIVRSYPALALSREIYETTHSLLKGSVLKGKYTRIHNKISAK